jgi:hypothetical protein
VGSAKPKQQRRIAGVTLHSFAMQGWGYSRVLLL